MPSRSTWKKQAFLLLSRLGSKRAAGSAAGSFLVVRAGFPTSLADLYVKNRTKILPKKPIKHRPVNPNPIPNPNPNPIPPPIIAVRSPNRTAESSITRRPTGLGFLVAVLGAVAVGKKWVVAVITILSLVLIIVEFFGLPEKNKKPGAAVGVVDLKVRGSVLLICEQSPGSDSSTATDVFLERSEILDSASDGFLEMSEISKERRDFYENPTKKKKIKVLRSLFRRKCSCKNKESGLEIKECIVEEDGDDTEFLSFEDDNDIVEVNSEEVVPVVANADENRLRKRMKLGFVAIILFGLFGGKVVAVALSIVWVLVFGCTGSVWRKGNLNLNEFG